MLWGAPFAKKLILILISLHGVAVIASQAFKAQIGERMFAKAVSKTIGNNVLTGLPGGVHVVLIGIGSPLTGPSREMPVKTELARLKI